MQLRTRDARAQRGMTLIELLAVMAIVGALAGMSLSALQQAGRGTALDGAQRVVRSGLTRARNEARERRAPAEVWLFPGDPSRIEIAVSQEAGTWSFDGDEAGRALGGRNVYSKLQGARIVDGGVVRKACDLSSGPMTCDPNPFHDPYRGFTLAMDVKPTDRDGGGELASFGDAFILNLVPGGGLEAVIEVEGEVKALALSTPLGVLEPNIWARVRLEVDGLEVRLLAHGVVEARKPLVEPKEQSSQARVIDLSEEPPPPSAKLARLIRSQDANKLTFGRRRCAAHIDEVIYRTLDEGVELKIPVGIVVDLPRPLLVRYGPDGRLDARLHSERVDIPLRREDETVSLGIDLSGVLR